MAGSSTFVDNLGVMRWTETKAEVCAFGTNYAIPFSYWDSRAPIGADQRKAIDEDVYHIARLGLDGYRIHVWNSYISDKAGNLVYNEHFELFDYLLFKLKQRRIKLFITPQKSISVTDPSLWSAHANYLTQFVFHVNPYTGIAYKDDPDILGFEIINEPHHFKAPDLVTDYINQMVEAIKNTGCEKPLFYNMTTCAQQIDQVLPSKVDGGTFQWYPTGLTSNHDQKGNLLPNVDQYHIPFADRLEGHRPKFVYEFSPSDVGDSAVMYPAMARSFREAGFQFAAHFAYDPMHAAYCNIEYRTHFVNLAYTPKKAIGLMIAAEVFRRTPMNKSYGRFPNNNCFDAFRLSYEDDLAEMVTEKQFFYSNDTKTAPPSPAELTQIAGTGSSVVVSYQGTGAYFLDKLEAGVWRLEVMPDVIWVKDPFFVADIRREAAVVQWYERVMRIDLPDLGSAFKLKALNVGNDRQTVAKDKRFVVSPGSYLVTRSGMTTNLNGGDSWNNIRLGEFHAPKRLQQQDYLLHESPREACVATPLTLNAQLVTVAEPGKVELVLLGVGGGKALPMSHVGAFEYSVTIPDQWLAQPGLLRYHISVQSGDRFAIYPSGTKASHLLRRRIYSGDRHLDDAAPYSIRIVEPKRSVCLFDATQDWEKLTKMCRQDRIDCFPAEIPGKQFMHLNATQLSKGEHDMSVRNYCRHPILTRSKDLASKQELVVHGHALHGRPCLLQVALMTTEGHTFGGTVTLNPEFGSYTLSLQDLKPVKSVLLPRPYPEFQLYWFESAQTGSLDLTKVESLQISIGPSIPEQDWMDKHGAAIGWIVLN